MKKCSQCGVDKELACFGKKSSSPDKLRSCCKICHRAKTKEWFAANPEKKGGYIRKWRESNKDHVSAYTLSHYAAARDIKIIKSRNYRESNKDKVAKSLAEYRAKNAEEIKIRNRLSYAKDATLRLKAAQKYRDGNRERIRDYAKNYAKLNPAERCARFNARRAKRLQATPVWADNNAIQRFYDEARRLSIDTGVLMSVDHIVPLISKFVCGLHTQDNLQIMTKTENARKGNRWWV